ncbi:MerR family transcriptional regulator [Paenibacillus sp. FSL H8-0122]|uniref:MerR family transcriptional regulator n=1 Tax=Paenibacillus sp. FSL H8-0122 TaxID=2954510 RepID=UPI0030F4D4F9
MIRIGELAKTANISKRTLYHYEQIELLQPAHISENGYRYYDNQAILRLQKILLLKSIGYTLEKIKGLLENKHSAQEDDHWIASLNEQIELIEQKKEELSRKQYYLRSTIHAIRLKGTENLQDLTHIISAMNNRPLSGEIIPAEFTEDSPFTVKETWILQHLPVLGSSNQRLEELVDIMGQAADMMSSSPYSSEAQALAGRLYDKALELFEGDAKLLDKYWEQIRPADGAEPVVMGMDRAMMSFIDEMIGYYLGHREENRHE